MRLNKNIILLIVLFINGIAIKTHAQTWPFKNDNGQVVRGKITGTVGEFRNDGTNARFHGGVDFVSPFNGADESRAVYSMHAGTATVFYDLANPDPWNDKIRITLSDGTYVYYTHIRPSSTDPITNAAVEEIESGDAIAVGDYLGNMVTDANGPAQHVHINANEGGSTLPGTINWLNTFLTPFTDSHSPDFVAPFDTNDDNSVVDNANANDATELWTNGVSYTDANGGTEITNEIEIDGQTHKVVFGNIDIISRTRDRHTLPDGTGSTDGNNGINEFSYEVLDEFGYRFPGNGETININFNEVPDNANANYVFDSRSTSAKHVYILTANAASEPYDRFWGSRIAFTNDENWETENRTIDAPISPLAEYEDGKYVLRVTTRDIANATNTIWNSTIRDTKILVDNFKPYIKKIEVRVAPSEPFYARVYEGEWNWDNQNKWLDFTSNGVAQASPADYLEFVVYSSEPLQTEGNMAPTLQLEGITDPPTLLPVTEENKYVFRLAPGGYDPEGADNGLKSITINGYDLAGNQLTGFDNDEYQITEDELPLRTNATTWSGRVSKVDTKHVIEIKGSICAPPGGRAPNSNCSFVIADFTFQSDNAHGKTIHFTDTSFPSEDISSWSWDFGDGNTSTSQNPSHTYQFTGEYLVMLTVSDGTEEDTRAEFISVSNDILIANFTATPTTGDAPLIVDLNSSGSQGNIQSWAWNITPNTNIQYVIGSNQSQNPTIQFDEPGNYEINLTVDNGSNSHTSDSQFINVDFGNVGETQPRFTWDGPVYANSNIQFYDDSFIKCIGDTPTYRWNIYGSSPQYNVGGNVPNPQLRFTEIGFSHVELCIDVCGETYCNQPVRIEVLDPSIVNSNVFAKFYTSKVTENNQAEVGEEVFLIDESYSSNGGTISQWDYWHEITPGTRVDSWHGPLTRIRADDTPPNNHPDTNRPTHVYANPGRYLIRSYVWQDVTADAVYDNIWEEVIIIRRPQGFCSESVNIDNVVYEFDSQNTEVSGTINVGISGPVTAENGSTVDFVSRRTRIRSGTHFHPGSKVHIKAEDCDVVRSTFEE